MDITSTKPSTLRRAVFILIICLALGGGIWLAREPLLRGAATVWVVSDPVTRADDIVLLGGDFQSRPVAAADLYHRHLAEKILVSRTTEYQHASGIPSYDELTVSTLLKAGVPSEAIGFFGTSNKNTKDEAVALRSWASKHAESTFIIPIESFGTRRVRWIFRREFSGAGVDIEVVPFEPRGYAVRDWWRSEQGVIAFQNEFLKYLYYRWEY